MVMVHITQTEIRKSKHHHIKWKVVKRKGKPTVSIITYYKTVNSDSLFMTSVMTSHNY